MPEAPRELLPPRVPVGLKSVNAQLLHPSGGLQPLPSKSKPSPCKVDFQFIVKEERLSDDHAADVTVSKALFLRLQVNF